MPTFKCPKCGKRKAQVQSTPAPICEECNEECIAGTALSFGPPKPKSTPTSSSAPKPKGIEKISDALALKHKKLRGKVPPWSAEKQARDQHGLIVRTKMALKHLDLRPYDPGSIMLAKFRRDVRKSNPINDALLYLNVAGEHTANCSMCTLAAIEGTTATHVVLRRQDSLKLYLDPTMHGETMWIKTEQASQPTKPDRQKVAIGDPKYPSDVYRKNRESTLAQLNGMIEYLHYVAEKAGGTYLVVRQGFPDLQPDDRKLFGIGIGDPLGEMYPTSDVSKGTLLGLMNAYPSGTRFAVFLFGGGGIGSMHWIYAERYVGRIVFEDYQKNLHLPEGEPCPPTAYLEEIPHHPIDNSGNVFSRGMFLALVPAFESAKECRNALLKAVEKHGVKPPNFHTKGVVEWPPLVVNGAKQRLSDAMITAINDLIPKMFARLDVRRTPLPLERDRTVFELARQEMGLAILYMDTLDGIVSGSSLTDLLTGLERAFKRHRRDDNLSWVTAQGLASEPPTDQEKLVRYLRRLWSDEGLRTVIIQYLIENDFGSYWTTDKLYPGKCGHNIAYPGLAQPEKALFLWREYQTSQEMYYYTAVHEFMHLQAGLPTGMVNESWTNAPYIANSRKVKTSGLRSTFDEGLTDLFAELLVYKLNKHDAFRGNQMKPPVSVGYRTYDYLRRGMYLAARRMKTTYTEMKLLNTYVGVKMLARALFDNELKWLKASLGDSDDTSKRLDKRFLGNLSELALEGVSYIAETLPPRKAVKALGLPEPLELSTANDPATEFMPYFWNNSWVERVKRY